MSNLDNYPNDPPINSLTVVEGVLVARHTDGTSDEIELPVPEAPEPGAAAIEVGTFRSRHSASSLNAFEYSGDFRFGVNQGDPVPAWAEVSGVDGSLVLDEGLYLIQMNPEIWYDGVTGVTSPKVTTSPGTLPLAGLNNIPVPQRDASGFVGEFSFVYQSDGVASLYNLLQWGGSDDTYAQIWLVVLKLS